MYPQGELMRLAAHKAALRARIARHREECVEAAGEVARPFEWLDRALIFWRQISPLAMIAAAPLGLLVMRRLSPRLKILRTLVRWGPLVFGALRGLGSTFKSRAAPIES